MLPRAFLNRAPQLTRASRRLLCADNAKPAVTAPHASAPKSSNSVAEALVPDLSDLQPATNSRLFTKPSGEAAAAAAKVDAPEVATEGVAAEGAGEYAASSGLLKEDSAKAQDVSGGGAPFVPEVVTESVEDSFSAGQDKRGSGARSGGQRGTSGWSRQYPSSVVFAEELMKLLRTNGARRAAFIYQDVLRSDNNSVIDVNVLRIIMPILSRVKMTYCIADTLKLVEERKIEAPSFVINFALRGLVGARNTDLMRATIDRMWSGPQICMPDAVTYNSLIAAYFFESKVDEAYEVLKEMKNRMVFPVWNTYQTLISGCLRANEPRRALETLLAVERDARINMNAPLIAQVMTMCAEDDDLSAVTQLIPRVEESLIQYEYDVLELAARRRTYEFKNFTDGSSTPEDAGGEEAKNSRGRPVLEMSAIMSCLRAGYRGSRPDICEKSMQWFAEMYPDVDVPESAWYCLVGSYATSGNFEAAFDVLSRMRRSGVQPSIKDLSEALVKPLAADLKVVDEQYYRLADILRPDEAATRLASESEDEVNGDVPAGSGGISSSKREAETVVAAEAAVVPIEGVPVKESGGAEQSAVASSLSFTQELLVMRDASANELTSNELVAGPVLEQDGQRTIDIDEFNCIIAACSMVGDLHRAFHTFDEAQRLGFVGNADTYNALLAGCLTDKHYNGGVRVAQEMKENGVGWDGETILLLVRLCIRCGNFNEAKDWLSQAVEEGIPVGSVVFQMQARKFMRLGQLDNLREVVALAERVGLSSTAVLARVERSFINDLHLLDTDQSSIHRDVGGRKDSKGASTGRTGKERRSRSSRNDGNGEAVDFDSQAI